LIHYFDYVIEILVIILSSIFVGNYLLKIINFPYVKSYTKIFLELSTGILLLTIIQAVISTKLNSILLITPIILAAGYHLDKKGLKLKHNGTYVDSCSFSILEKYFVVFEVFVLALLFYSIKFFALFQNGDTYLIGPDGYCDFTYYSRCADYMLRTGIETCNNDYLFPVTSKPYHFGDLWFIALITNVNKNITHFSEIFTFRAIYLVVVYAGIMAILENKYPVNFKIKAAVGLSIFFAPLYLDAYVNVRFLSEMWLFTQTFFEAPKLFFIQVLLIASILLNIIGYKKLAIATLLSIPVVYTVTIIPVYAGFMVYLIYVYLCTKKILYDEFAIFIVSASYILVYYFIVNPSDMEVDTTKFNLIELVNFRHTINIIGGTFLAHIILYLPVGIVFFAYVHYTKLNFHQFSRKLVLHELRRKPMYIFILSMPVFSLLLWSITSGDVNSVQLFYNIAMPVFYIGAIFILLISFISFNRNLRVLIFTFLLLTAIHEFPKFPDMPPKYSADFIREIHARKNIFNGIYVTYKPLSYYDSIFSFYDKVSNFGNYFAYLNNNTQPVSLDMIDVPIAGDIHYERMAKQSLESSTFYRYVDHKKKERIFKSNSEYQLDFIAENNIKVLVTLNSVQLPDYLNALVIERIEDSLSGEVICILRGRQN
jgi:hypothetical protein